MISRPLRHLLLFTLIFLSATGFLFAQDIPEFQLLMYNDTLGFGWAQDWDDYRNFGLAARYFADPWAFSLEYTGLTDRSETPATAVRTDLLGLSAGYTLDYSIWPVPMRLSIQATLGISGQLGGFFIQKGWHDLVGVIRPCPQTYTNIGQIWPGITLQTGPFIDLKSSNFFLLGEGSLEQGTVYLGARAGLAERFFRGESGFFAQFKQPVYSYETFLAGSAKENETGLWIGWNAEVSGLRIENRFNPVSGTIDYAIGISTRAWNNTNNPGFKNRAMGFGMFLDRFCFSSMYSLAPGKSVSDEGQLPLKFRMQMQDGRRAGDTSVPTLFHIQQLTLGAELPFMLELGEWKLGIYQYLGPGIRTEQEYVPLLSRVQILSEEWFFSAEAETGIRIEWHNPAFSPSWYALEAGAGITGLFLFSSRGGFSPGIRADFSFTIRLVMGLN